VVAAALVVGVAAALLGVLPGPLGGVDPAGAAGAVELLDDDRTSRYSATAPIKIAPAVRAQVLLCVGGQSLTTLWYV
jgi:hypothetical protein